MKELLRSTLTSGLTLILSSIYLSFDLLHQLVNLARTYIRYILALMFALPVMILSSSTASTIWAFAYLVNNEWIPGSQWIKSRLTSILVYTYTFGHGSWLKLTGLAVIFYVFLPVPAPALAYLAQDMEGVVAYLHEEIFTGGPAIHPALLDWTKLIFFILGYRQIVNFISNTDAWNGIVTGSNVFTPKMMRVVIHFQVFYTIALLSYINAQLKQVSLPTEPETRRSDRDAFFRQMKDDYMQFRRDAGAEGMWDEDYNRDTGPKHKPPRPTSKKKNKRSKMASGTAA